MKIVYVTRETSVKNRFWEKAREAIVINTVSD